MPNLLIISSVWVEPKSSAAGKRMLQLIEFFLTQNYNIVYQSTSQLSEFRFDLTTIGVFEEIIELNSSSFDLRIKEINPEIVIYDRFLIEEQFGWRVRENRPEAFTILDTEDLHSLRKSRQLALKQNVTFNNSFWKNQEITLREIASIYRSDLSLIISEAELDLLQENFTLPKDALFYLPLLAEQIEDNLPSYDERINFVTIGNFLHEPNWDSVQWLKKDIWPLIRKQLPKAELHIYGAYATQKVTQLHNPKQGFFIEGRAESVTDVMQNARICLAPLRFGGGLKGKFFDAMKNGTPSITTPIGQEGISTEWAGYIGIDREDISNKAVHLYTNEMIWNKHAKKGHEILSEEFNKEDHVPNFKTQLDLLILEKESNRNANFIGEMLSHQSMNSTKYFSKWIEEKNKITK